jgi:hypothetical protein
LGGTHSYYVLIASDAYTQSGGILAAREIVSWRLDRGEWGLYRKTANRNRIKKNDRVLIYMGGLKRMRRHVVASASVSQIVEHRVGVRLDPPDVEGEYADRSLLLKDIRHQEPVDVRSLLDELDFVPKNRSKWGVALMGGCREVSKADYERLRKG